MTSISQFSSAALASAAGALRFLPEPQNRVGSMLSSFGGAVARMATAATGLEGGGSAAGDLLGQQIEVQRELMLVTLQSNLLRSKHETEMAPVRNIRVG